MEFSDNHRVTLFRLIIRPFGEDNFRVLRWGGHSKVLTHRFGVEVIRLLQAGHTIGAARSALAVKHGSNPARVDLAPLLQTLHKAQFIKSIDGQPASDGRTPSLSNTLWFCWRYYLSPWLRRFSEAFLPIAMARRLGFWTHAIDLRPGMKPALANAARNMAVVERDKAPVEIGRLTRDFYRHWIWNVVDIDTFETRDPEVLDRWMGRHMSCHGLEHLERARAENRGVILCIFHFSSTRLIPLLLMKHGYPVTAIGPANMGWGMGKTLGVLARFKTRLPHYGSLRLFGDFTLQNLRDLVDALHGGDVACCMAGVIPGTPRAEHAPPPDVLRYFGYSSQQFPRASAPVNFLGQRLEMTAWVGWLAAVSGAAVLPTIMLRKDDKSLELRIGPPVAPDAAGPAKARDTINTALYHTLEQYVARHPSQWFAWHNLHHVGLRVPASDSPAVPVKSQTVTIPREGTSANSVAFAAGAGEAREQISVTGRR